MIGDNEADVICWKPPPGWYCTRLAGHDGPCAAVQDPRVSKDEHISCPEYTGFKLVFGLHDEQRDVIHAWIKKHDAEKHIAPGKTRRYSGAIGGAYTYEFTGTSIGTCTHVRCACGEGIDVSNYDDW